MRRDAIYQVKWRRRGERWIHGDRLPLREPEPRKASGELLECEVELFTGQLRAGAAAHAASEGEIAVGWRVMSTCRGAGAGCRPRSAPSNATNTLARRGVGAAQHFACVRVPGDQPGVELVDARRSFGVAGPFVVRLRIALRRVEPAVRFAGHETSPCGRARGAVRTRGCICARRQGQGPGPPSRGVFARGTSAWPHSAEPSM